MRVDLQAPAHKKDKHQLQDNLVRTLKGMTPNEAAQWVESNVTDLASAKTAMKAMARVIVYILRNQIDAETFRAK